MTPVSSDEAGPAKIGYRKLRAPAEDGGALIDPTLEVACRHLENNRVLAADYRFDILGEPFAALRQRAVESLRDIAYRHTSRYRDLAAIDAKRPIVLSGHQPQLFHPGVWFKNFLLAELARRSGAQAINLIVDNDTVRETSIRVPTMSGASALVDTIPYDADGPAIPFEERSVLDEALFRSFAARVCLAMPAYVGAARGEAPLVDKLWRPSSHDPNLGLRLAMLRNRLEADFMEAPGEAPLSLVCGEPPFLHFALGVLADLPRFAAIYNAALAEYRRVHRLRNARHPMPSLDVAKRPGDWNEAPFWIWTSADPRRRRLYARSLGKSIELSDRAEWRTSLHQNPQSAVATLLDARRGGVKIRPRALVTTLYARLFLGDLFVHGIGGAKYDQVTDAILERYYGVAAPAFVTATATYRLPIERPTATIDDLRRLEQEQRDLRYHPERWLAGAEIASLAHAKLRWTASGDAGASLTLADRRARHADIASVNSALAPLVADRVEDLRSERETLQRDLRSAQILGSREFSFCLFPEQQLVEQFQSSLR